MSEIYGFWQGPTYRPTTRDELWESALDMPMSLGSTLVDQTLGGGFDSWGAGTAIKTLTLPPRASTRRGRETDAEYQARQERVKGITEDEYKASPYFRDNVPWDSGMTEDRAAALALNYDARRVREHFAEKRPITAFIGNLAGQALDPINYIPILGPSVRAAAVARMGVVKGVAATAALDAAANTAIAGLATRETRRGFGDDVSWQMMVSEIATAALLGTAFGTVGGLLQRRAGIRADALRSEAEVKVNTLRATQEARIALNEAIGGLANDGEVRLSPNGVAPIERMANETSVVTPQSLRANPAMVDLSAATDAEILAFSDSIRGQSKSSPDAVKKIDRAFNKFEITPETYDLIEEAAVPADKPFRVFRGRDGDPAMIARTGRTNSSTFRPDAARTFGGAGTPDEAIAEILVSPGTRVFAPKSGIRGGEVVFAADTRYETVGRDAASGMHQIVARPAELPAKSVDASPARPEPLPTGRAEAEAKVAKPENYKALAEQYRVDPEAGTFPEEAELRQLAQAGRLSDEDMAVMDAADETFQDGAAFGEALKTAVNCLL